MPDTSLPEVELFHETVHQIEDGDPVNGGVPDRATRSGGPNIAAKMLADRTRWLRARVAALTQALTPAELLSAIKTVDGIQSGLDADLLDGRHATDFIAASREGPGNGLNADRVDGRHASEFVLASTARPGGGLDADTVDGRHADQIRSEVGDIKAYLAEIPPVGWVPCHGAEVSKADFAALWDRCGPWLAPGSNANLFRLPDLRGVFLRGVDLGRGYDAGRALGSLQTDMLASHTHTTTVMADRSSGGAGNLVYGDEPFYNPPGAIALPSSAAGGRETRPVNIAVNYCIKF